MQILTAGIVIGLAIAAFTLIRWLKWNNGNKVSLNLPKDSIFRIARRRQGRKILLRPSHNTRHRR